jgi:hypothetical protein
MTPVLESVLVRQNQQHPLQPFVGKLDDPAATLADQMFVVTLRDRRLVTLEPFPKLVSADEAAFHQEVEGAIDRSHSHPLAVAFQLAANAVHREVVLGEKDDLGDEISLAGEWLPMFPEVAMEALEKSRSLSLIQSCH